MGSVPLSLKAGVGIPVVVTVNVPGSPSVNVVMVALVIAGACGTATVSVKLWVALGDTPLAAVIVSGYVPELPAAGLPASVAVPSLLSTKITPEGSAPVSLKEGVGIPLAVTVKRLDRPIAKVVASALVIAAPGLFASRRLCHCHS